MLLTNDAIETFSKQQFLWNKQSYGNKQDNTLNFKKQKQWFDVMPIILKWNQWYLLTFKHSSNY